MEFLKIIFGATLLASNYLLVSLIISAFAYKKIRWPDLINTKIMILNSLILIIPFILILWGLPRIITSVELPEILLGIISFMFLTFIPTYEYFVSPYVLIRNSKLKEIEKHSFDFEVPKNIKIYLSDQEFANAYALGSLPNSKTIILSNDVYNHMSKSELGGIIAHEIGHLHKNHAFKLFLSTLLAFFIGYASTFYFYPIIDNSGYNIHILRGIHGAFFYGLPLWLIPSLFQRKFEFEADKYAALYSNKNSIIEGLKKLDELSLGKVTTGGLTHPGLKQRIAYIKALTDTNES